MKKIFKFVAFGLVLSMILGVGMVSNVYADTTTKYQCQGVLDVTTQETIEPCGEIFDSYQDWAMHASTVHAPGLIQGETATSAAPITISSGTDINLTNSSLNVQYDSLDKTNGTNYFTDETTNVWADGQIVEECRVTVALESAFTITIPKEIVLDGNTKKADYTVNVQGDIAGDQKITVTPDVNFEMVESGGKANVTATVTQPDTDFVYNEISPVDGKTVDGSIEALDLTAGTWSGKYMFNIKFE